MACANKYMAVAWVYVACHCSAFLLFSFYLMRQLDRRTRLPLVLTVPAAWVAVEFLRSHAMTGFPWYLLAHTQHDFLPLIQISDVTGAYGVSFLVAAVNALLFEVLFARPWFRGLVVSTSPLPAGGVGRGVWGMRFPLSKLTLLRQAVALLAVLMAVLGYGLWRLSQDSLRPGPRVALLKGTEPQPFRNARGSDEEDAELTSVHFRRLCDAAAAFSPDLIVWPETSWPGDYYQAAAEIPYNELPRQW
jgi:apolipoprotein N-acyltransferase